MFEVQAELYNLGYQLRIYRTHSVGLLRKKIAREAVSWKEGARDLPPLVAAALDELEQSGQLTEVDSSCRSITFATAAQLGNQDANAFGLPASFPFQLDIQSRGTLGTANFEIRYHASESGARVSGRFSDGIFSQGDRQYRISGLLYLVIREINRINNAVDAEHKIAAFAALRLLLPDGIANSKIQPENFLLRIRIAHVTAIGLSPSIDNGAVSFDPVPMRRRDPENSELGAELATTPAAAEKFAHEFRVQVNVNSTYAIDSGQYVYVDPSIRTALDVVKQKQSASLEERMAFLMSPSRAITEAFRDLGIESEQPIGDGIFFETSEYSERITGIGEWIPPQLSFLENEQNNWLPERFSIVLAGKLVIGAPEDVKGWIEEVKSALSSKRGEVRLSDVVIPANTPGLLETLLRLQPPEDKPGASIDEGEQSRDEPRRRRITVLQTKSNFDASEYKRGFRRRRLEDAFLPMLKADLKSHQRDGVAWLSTCYKAGWPGVLLADDMGLGKTLQSLSFLMLLKREGIIKKGHPALVVAPTSLLRNWRDEHDKWTLDGGIGKPLVAFGVELKNLKLGVAEADGIVLLDSFQISQSTWILTTYETIRDYHLSFARVPFSVAVFDEIQKAKNPATRINASLKSLNIDFVLSMTGTPVENSISDLWAITDITAPGYFAPLKDFMKKYGKAQDNNSRKFSLEKLSNELLRPTWVDGNLVPSYALRRLKEDVAKDLPRKFEGPMFRADMPPVQAQRYAEISAATQAGRVKILRALHDFRSISLHPIDPDSVAGGLVNGAEYISMSARLSQAFYWLEQIAFKQEKVIIFVNSRRMQTLLSRLIERRFGCPKPEYIRGDTISAQRQDIVDRFSKLNGFAALILSPRAAGVGLNIVAANHVIHLDRWWNPAVEDQCTDRAYRIGATKEVYVYTVGAVHPQLADSSYDIVLDNLLRSRREASKRIFTSSEITAADLIDAMTSADRDSGERLLREIDASDYLGLEEFVRDRLISEGLAVNMTRRTGDGGADIVVRDELGQIIYLVQCKHTLNVETPVDAGLLQDAQRVRGNWNAPDAIVVGVSNAKKFAPRVVEAFNFMGGRLISRDELCSMRLISAGSNLN